MKKILFTFYFLLLPFYFLLLPLTSNAALLWDIYAGPTAGIGGAVTYDNTNNEHKNYGAHSFGAVLGIDLPIVRIEGEYDYLNIDDTNTSLAMANAYLKMPTTFLVPYIGAGIGTTFGGDIDNTVTYAGMLGATIDTEILPLKFDIEGRALYMPDFVTTVDMLQYEGRIKIRYVF